MSHIWGHGASGLPMRTRCRGLGTHSACRCMCFDYPRQSRRLVTRVHAAACSCRGLQLGRGESTEGRSQHVVRMGVIILLQGTRSDFFRREATELPQSAISWCVPRPLDQMSVHSLSNIRACPQHVFVDRHTRRPVPIPPALAASLRKLTTATAGSKL